MTTIVSEIPKMSVPEKAELYKILAEDAAVLDYIYTQKVPAILYEELKNRDAAFEAGTLPTMTMAELFQKLDGRKNAS